MHYAAINDNAQLIETLFLHAKANPNAMQPTSDFIKLPDDSITEATSVGALDENFNSMAQQMDVIDTLFIDG